ncbi:MAG TPA: PQQ-binding-like beta-propeller repeat protein, partial [candidate division Zixibacteria bacterium]|nr:PQQ-binding-like beta-propeller repeat protein [candidate division Zixibacteria bacterium]
NNSVWALNANTGATLWNRTGINNAAASLLSGAPIVFDTLLIIHDNGVGGAGRRFVSALNVRNGTTVWTSAQMPFRIFLGPALSNDTIFVAGRGTGISGDGGGQIVSLNAHTGAVIATYDDSLAINYQNGVVVFGNNLVACTRNDGTSLDSTSSIQVWKHTHDITTSPSQFTPSSFYLDRFSTPEVYVEPSVGETVIVYGTAGKMLGSGTGAADIVMYRILPSFSFRSSMSTVGTIHAPGAVAGGNGLLLQGDDAGYWYALDGNSYGVAFGGLAHYWHKIFPSHLTAGTAISPDDDTLVVIIDGNGNCYGWRSGGVGSRPRVETYYDQIKRFPMTEVFMNIIPPDTIGGTGGSDETTLVVFENVGTATLTYSINWVSSPSWLSVNDLNGGVASPGNGIILKLTAINPNIGYGDFYGEIKLFNTNEPDAPSVLDTTRMLVRLKVGCCVNQPPTIINCPAKIKADPGDTVAYNFLALDDSLPSGQLIWKKLDGPGSFDSVTGQFIWISPSQPIAETLIVSVSDSELFSEPCTTFIFITNPTMHPLKIRAFSPVNLVVTDPTLDSIGFDTIGTSFDTIFNTIDTVEGLVASYDSMTDANGDGERDDIVVIPRPYPGPYKIRVIPADLGSFDLDYQVDGNTRVLIGDSVIITTTDTNYTYGLVVLEYLRGDVNQSHATNLSDIVALVNIVFKGSRAPDPRLANVNCDYKDGKDKVDIADIIKLVNVVFKGDKACS